MPSYSNSVVDKSGYRRPLQGVQVYTLNPDGSLATSAAPQPAVTDAFGNFSITADDGVYELDYRVAGVTYAKETVTIGTPPQYVGPTGPAQSTYPSIAALKAAPVTNRSYILADGVNPPVTYAYVTGDFSAVADKDDKDVVSLNAVPASAGALKRSYAAEKVQLRSYARFVTLTNGKLDWSTALASAVSDVEANPSGGTVELPSGIFRINGAALARPNNPIFDRPVRICGQGIGATEVWPTKTGDIMFNLVGRNFTTIDTMTIRAGTEYQAYAGIVCARTLTSNNCNSNAFRDLHIIGNFSAAPAISIAAESAEWHRVTFEPAGGSSGVALIWGSKTNSPNVQLQIPGITNLTPENANTDVCFLDCRFFNAQVPNRYVVQISGGASGQFCNCAWIAPGAAGMVRLTDPTGGIIGGGINFTNSHFEGSGDIFNVEMTDGATYLRGIREKGCSIVTDGGVYLNYSRTDPSKLLVIQESEFRPGAALSVERAGLVLYADIIDRSVVDFTQLGSAGTITVLLQAKKSELYGTDIRCWGQDQSSIVYPVQAYLSPPSSGVFPKGHFISNGGPSSLNTPLSIGQPFGWVALAGGSVDTSSGSMMVTTAAGSAVATLGGVYNLYEGARIYIGGAIAQPFALRAGGGTTIYLSAPAPASGIFPLTFSGETLGKFAPVGLVGATQAAAQPDSTATTVSDLANDINSLLAKLRASHVMQG